jgi:hypothetical protein
LARVSDLVETLAGAQGISPGTLTLIARNAREAGLLSQGARGVNAPKATNRDAATLFLIANATEHPKEAVNAFTRFSSLPMESVKCNGLYWSSMFDKQEINAEKRRAVADALPPFLRPLLEQRLPALEALTLLIDAAKPGGPLLSLFGADVAASNMIDAAKSDLPKIVFFDADGAEIVPSWGVEPSETTESLIGRLIEKWNIYSSNAYDRSMSELIKPWKVEIVVKNGVSPGLTVTIKKQKLLSTEWSAEFHWADLSGGRAPEMVGDRNVCISTTHFTLLKLANVLQG